MMNMFPLGKVLTWRRLQRRNFYFQLYSHFVLFELLTVSYGPFFFCNLNKLCSVSELSLMFQPVSLCLLSDKFMHWFRK